eukprot:439559_1
MARVGWVPFRNTIDTFRIANQTQADPYPLSIDFNIKYAIPCITKCCGITASMEYDFSSRTIRHLVAVLSMVEGKSKYHDAWTDERILSIKFGKTLRLLTLQDLLLLLSVCQKQNIKILDIIEPKVFDFGTAIQMSKKMDKDCRLFQHARNAQGRPLLMVFADLALDPPEIQSKMMYRLLQYDLDVNLTDVASGESLIFSLLRHFDYSTIRYLLTRYCEGKKIKINLNYYNKNGLSPLYVALQSYRNEKHMKCKRFMFDYLMSYDAPLLNASIKENTAMSPLWFAIKVIDDKTLIKTLLQRGCKLNIEEMNKLSHLYCDYAIKDNNKILATITQSKQPNDDEKEEEKANEPDINEQIHAIRKLRYEFIKYRIDATKKGNDIDEDDTFVFESNLTSIYRVIQRCNLPQSYVCDANQDNPLHLCIKSAIQQTKASDVNVIKILKLECPQWLYLRNADGKTPIDLCIDARHVRLFETLLFDTKDEKYLLDSKRQTQVEGMKKRIPIPDADIGALRLTLNASLYHKLVSRCNHIENFNVLLTWIIDVTDDLLSPYLKSVPPKLLDIQDLQTDATILDCGVESKLLKHYMQSDDPNKIDATNTILMLLQCILNSNDESGRSPLVSLCAEKYKLYVIDVLVHHFDLKLGEQDASIIECYTKQCESVRANENDAILRMLNKAFGVKTDADKTKEPDETESKEDAKEDMNGMSDDEADTDHEAKSKDEVDADETKANVMSDEEQQLSEALIADHNEESKLKVVSVVDALLMDELNEETNASSWVELIYSTFVESLSMADFITDFLVLKQLFEGGHQWWSSWMVLMMLSSYLVSFSVVGTLFVNAVSAFVQDRQLNKQSGCTCRYVLFVLMAILLMTPLNVLYFFIVDCVFMVYVLVSAMIYFVTCSHVDITDWIDDYVFQKLLGMNRMQIIGYRRLRTLSQLLFETIPQLLLQIHMLRVSNLDGLDAESLIVSILFALLHM